MKRKINDLVVWSNVAFIAPLFFAISKTLYLYAVLILLVFVFSCLFHYYKERKFRLIDTIFAWLLIGANLYSFYSKGFSNYFWVALVFVIIGFYFKSKNHSIWHISSAMITILAII